MQQALDYFNALNRDYFAVHQEKEALFWQHYMGISDDGAAQAFLPLKVSINVLSLRLNV